MGRGKTNRIVRTLRVFPLPCSPSVSIASELHSRLLAPAYAHHDTDQDGGSNDDAEQVLEDYAPGIRSRDATLSPVSRRGGLSLYPHGVGGL
jgi:hypothetical protein